MGKRTGTRCRGAGRADAGHRVSIKMMGRVVVVVAAALGGVLSNAASADEPSFPVVVNEVMASNTATIANNLSDFADWIELYNASDMPLDLAGMYLTDDLDDRHQWRFPTDDPGATIIEPGGYLLIWADSASFPGELHTNFGLDSQGDQVYLIDSDALTVLESLAFDRQTPDISYGRHPDGGADLRFFGEPTPAAPNSEGYLGEVAPVRFSRERGFCDSPFLLTMTCPTEGAQILYTIDGRTPDDDSGRGIAGAPYTEPLWIDRTTCVRAMALKPGWKPSAVETHTYIFDASAVMRSLPVISLVGSAYQSFYEPYGVMAIVGGTYSNDVWSSSGSGSYNNPMDRGLERPVSFEWLDPDGSGTDVQIDCGLRVHGSPYMRPRYIRQNGLWSGFGKFSFRLYFRGEYGQNSIEYPFFTEPDVDRYKSIVLRAGHNDQTNPFVKDELIRRLFRDMGSVGPIGTHAVLLVNGQYKGFYNPTEHVKEEMCQEWFDSDKPWDVMTMNGLRDGESASWDAMIAFARGQDLTVEANYEELGRRLDIPQFIDYLIMRLWPNDWDWPQNNWSAAAERSESGQWKFFVWDAEGTFETSELNVLRFGQLNSQNNANAYLYRALKASATFRQRFGDRLYKHFYNGGALTAENVERRFRELQEELAVAIPNMNTYILDTWLPSRQSVFLNGCIGEGLYTYDGPTFALNGASVQSGHAAVGDTVSISSPRAGSNIYYTLDGSNPGTPGPAGPSTLLTLVTRDTAKRVLVPSGPIDEWPAGRRLNDSQWTVSSGLPGGVGYERSSGYEGYITTDVGDEMYGVNGSCYIRIPFTPGNIPSDYDNMTLHVQFDDGFIAYLNGVEIARRNFTGEPAWNSLATSSNDDISASLFQAIDVTEFMDSLTTGTNILSIHAMNVSETSSDFLNNTELTLSRATGELPQIGAAAYTDPIPLTKTVKIKARVLVGNAWSALNEIVLSVGPVAENLRINEIMFHPANTGGPDDPNTEYIELINTGSTPVDLNFVTVAGGVRFTFGEKELAPGQLGLIVRDLEAFQAKYGSRGSVIGEYEGDLSDSGERIDLIDAAGTLIQSVVYDDNWFRIADGGGFSLTATDPAGAGAGAWSTPGAWRPSAVADGTPNFDDAALAIHPGAIVINELLANSSGGIPDWIELHNTTDAALDISGWFLSDDADDLRKYEIAPGTIVPAGGYALFTDEAHFGNAGDPGTHAPFGLSRDGETVYLHSGVLGALTGYSQRQAFAASEAGVSLGRYETSTGGVDFIRLAQATPGYANAYPRIGPVVISEIMYHPSDTFPTEYIELLNVGAADVTLHDFSRDAPWALTVESEGFKTELLFDAETPITLVTGQALLVVQDRAAFESGFVGRKPPLIVEWAGGRLDDDGATVTLSKPADADDDGQRQWITIDSVSYSDGAHPERFGATEDPWPTEADGQGLALERIAPDHYGNDASNWQAVQSSPGRP